MVPWTVFQFGYFCSFRYFQLRFLQKQGCWVVMTFNKRRVWYGGALRLTSANQIIFLLSSHANRKWCRCPRDLTFCERLVEHTERCFKMFNFWLGKRVKLQNSQWRMHLCYMLHSPQYLDWFFSFVCSDPLIIFDSRTLLLVFFSCLRGLKGQIKASVLTRGAPVIGVRELIGLFSLP